MSLFRMSLKLTLFMNLCLVAWSTHAEAQTRTQVQDGTETRDRSEVTTPELPMAFRGLSEAGQAGWRAKQAGVPARAQEWMIAAANPLAVEAGADVLRAGGSAADAMVAVQAVLGLVEPQSSGLGGGAFLVWYDAATGEVTTLDGRGTAPMAATPRLFQTETGRRMFLDDVLTTGRAVSTPGTVKLMEEAHRRWGRRAWTGLFDRAIALARQGFVVSDRLAGLVKRDARRLALHPATEEYFLPGGKPVRAGDRLVNPAYAETLRLVARGGAEAFYRGPIAVDLVGAVRADGADGAADPAPGLLSMRDLAAYRVAERPAVCVPYRGHDVCGMGPPSSGGLTVGQILGLLDRHDLAGPGPSSPEAWRLIGDATRLAFADRDRFVADLDFVPVPVEGLLAPGYLDERARLLRGDDALPEVVPGQPEFDHALLWADHEGPDMPATSHVSIVDGDGNALAMTTTIVSGFGSRIFVRGFLLNNELVAFSFRSHRDGVPIANRVEPGKRPRSSMAPTIVLRDGAPVLVTGSPGSSRIIGYVAQSIIAMLDWGMDVQQAVAMPHLINRYGTFELESRSGAEALSEGLAALGYDVDVRSLVSGLHLIALGQAGLEGGADPRREGIALGE